MCYNVFTVKTKMFAYRRSKGESMPSEILGTET